MITANYINSPDWSSLPYVILTGLYFPLYNSYTSIYIYYLYILRSIWSIIYVTFWTVCMTVVIIRRKEYLYWTEYLSFIELCEDREFRDATSPHVTSCANICWLSVWRKITSHKYKILEMQDRRHRKSADLLLAASLNIRLFWLENVRQNRVFWILTSSHLFAG